VIPAEHAHLQVAAVSHPGMSGKNNEDRYGVSAYHLDQAASRPAVLAIVADGIGGHRAGEVAAEIAVETISRVVAESDASQPVQILQEAIVRAGQVIHDQAETDTSLKGMGSTCACVWIIGSRLYTASVGDTRVYLIRGNTINQLTTDHTWVQEAIESGILRQEEARGHPNAHVIRRYLGSRNDVVPDTRLRLYQGEGDKNAEANQGTNLGPGDCVLICSDGLTDLVDDSEILAFVKDSPLQDAVEKLTSLANHRGGHDNITIVALQVPEVEGITVPVAVPARRLPLRAGCLAATILAFAAILVFGGMYLFFGRPSATSTPTATLYPVIQPSVSPQPTLEASITVTPSPTPFPPASTTASPSGTRQPLPGAIQPTLTPWPTNTRAP
jgi:protein phosphatase